MANQKQRLSLESAIIGSILQGGFRFEGYAGGGFAQGKRQSKRAEWFRLIIKIKK